MKVIILMAFLLLNVLLPVQALPTALNLPEIASGEPLNLTAAEIAALVNECGERTTGMMRRIFNYAYTETALEYEVGKRGRVTRERSKVYEVTPVVIGGRGRFTRVQVSEDGAPLSGEKIARERERIVKQLTDAEQDADKSQSRLTVTSPYKPKFWSYGIVLEQHKFGGVDKSYYPIRPTDFLVWHEFYAPRRAVFNGREAILLSFRPRARYVYDRSNVPFTEGIESFGRVMSQFGGRIWIDAVDKVIMRIEVTPAQELIGTNTALDDVPNASVPIGFELMRLPTGVWMPGQSWYNSYGRENIFWKTGLSHARRYGDFKLYRTEVKDVSLDASKPQP